MRKAKCGFDDAPGVAGADMLALIGPTLIVNIGFDPAYQATPRIAPKPGIAGAWALVDTGASESCVDAQLATALHLPLIDQKPISGTAGSHTVGVYLAQIMSRRCRTRSTVDLPALISPPVVRGTSP